MEKINFKIELDPAILEERGKLIKELKKDPLIQQFCQKSGCGLKLVEDYPYRFKKWRDGLNACRQCSDLKNCVQENRGQIYDLKYNGYLDFVLRDCRFAAKKKEEEAHLSQIVINDMPGRIQTMTLEKLEVDQENADGIAAIAAWLEAPNEFGFYIQGPVGIGKSTLAAVACNYFARKKQRVAFVNVPSWVARMKGFFHDPETYQKQIRILQKVDFAVFDDIGAESVTAWVRDELLFPILNERMEEQRMTWFTSNEDWNSLYDHYRFSAKFGEEEMKAVRIMERIKSLSKLLQLSGKNRRNQAN